MRSATALLTLFLLAACASSDGFVDETVKTCGPGDLLQIEAGMDPQSSPIEQLSSRLTMLVEVANNSNEDVTVKFVRVDPISTSRDSLIELDNGSRDFGEVVAQGDAHTFEVPLTARRRGGPLQQRATGNVRAAEFDVAVTVGLSSGDSYRCRFRVPVFF
jgi:hypothetical protein